LRQVLLQIRENYQPVTLPAFVVNLSKDKPIEVICVLFLAKQFRHIEFTDAFICLWLETTFVAPFLFRVELGRRQLLNHQV